MNVKIIIFVSDIRSFKEMGDQILKTATQLKEDIYSYHILVSTGVEVLLKSLIAAKICLDSQRGGEKEILKEIKNNLISFDHNIDKIFTKVFEYFPEFKNNLEISQIERFQNDFLYEYRIILNDGKTVPIKDSESARYQSFAKNRNALAQAPQGHEIEFINNLKEESNKIYKRLVSEVRKIK